MKRLKQLGYNIILAGMLVLFLSIIGIESRLLGLMTVETLGEILMVGGVIVVSITSILDGTLDSMGRSSAENKK
jgi:hypothetical protein